jgi:hypothetical protein
MLSMYVIVLSPSNDAALLTSYKHSLVVIVLLLVRPLIVGVPVPPFNVISMKLVVRATQLETSKVLLRVSSYQQVVMQNPSFDLNKFISSVAVRFPF